MIRTLDLFCGAGGSSWGARRAGAAVVAGVDVSATALAAFSQNFPEAKPVERKLEKLDPVKLRRRIGHVDLLLASPECTNHSPAKGNAPRSEASKRTALQVVRFADAFKPRWIVIENVVNMRRWSRYGEMLEDLGALGYNLKPMVLNSADFGVRQTRRRLFVIADRLGDPRPPKKRDGARRSVRPILRLGNEFDWRPLNAKGRAEDTLTRARRAIDALGDRSSFLLVYYGSDGAGGWQRLDRPLRTITTLDRFALVKPGADGHQMRMLQVPELKAAMGMPSRFVAGLGTRRDQIRAIGNAVCPPVMTAVVRALAT